MSNRTRLLTFSAASFLLGGMATLHGTLIIPTVPVGNAGNPADGTTYGAVSNDYFIGTNEVTNSQYVEFLNAVAASDPNNLYNSSMGSDSKGGISRSGTSGSFTYSIKPGMTDKPVNFVSFWDAARFANWLTNGQGSGSTETGVYDLTDANAILNNTVTRNATAVSNGGFFIPSENEWYKAAYYSGSPTGADGDGYWLYPTQGNTITTAEANYGGVAGNTVTSVGSYPNPSFYGTFDQGGNVWEWNDTIIIDVGDGNTSKRGIRGGAYPISATFVAATFRDQFVPEGERNFIGFRVAQEVVPEPSTYAAIMGALAIAFVAYRRRK